MDARTRLVCRLLGGLRGDPCLLVDVDGARRAVLVDLGEVHGALTPAICRRTTHLLVSHTHIDHFAGFPRLLRFVLDQERTLTVHGPPGMGAHVAGALAAFTWNYPDSAPIVFDVHEWGEGGAVARTRLAGRSRFAAQSLQPPTGSGSDDGVFTLLDDGELTIRAAVLDHGVPVLAFAIDEPAFHNIDTAALEAHGWPPGPWLSELKDAARAPAACRPQTLETPQGPRETATLVADLVRVQAGRRVAYVTDTVHSPTVAGRVAALARGADPLWIEHMFRADEADVARRKMHLTTRQAGQLAAAAGARRIEAFHLSRKYAADPDPLIEEARQAWREAGGEP